MKVVCIDALEPASSASGASPGPFGTYERQRFGLEPLPTEDGGGTLAEQRVLPEGARPTNVKQRYIQPEDVGATLLASAGLPYAEYRSGVPLWPLIQHKPF